MAMDTPGGWVGHKIKMINLKLFKKWWLTPVILASQEAKIRRIMIQSQPMQIVCKALS
jgi:hypothetical protein